MSFLSNIFGKKHDDTPTIDPPTDSTAAPTDVIAPIPPIQTDSPAPLEPTVPAPETAAPAVTPETPETVQPLPPVESTPSPDVTIMPDTPDPSPVQETPAAPGNDDTNPPAPVT